MDRGIYHIDVLPTSGNGSVTDIVATRDWNTSLVELFSTQKYINTHSKCLQVFMIGKVFVLASALCSSGCGYEGRQNSHFFPRPTGCAGAET